MFRNNSHYSHSIRPDGKRLVQMKLYCGIIHCNGFLQHGKIIDRAVVAAVIVGKRYVFCCQWFSVCKFYIVTDLYCPDKPVLTDRIICGKIHSNRQIFVGNSKCALYQRLMNMLSGSPAICRIKSRLRLRSCRHGNNHFILCFLFCC